ncbi:DUF2249 domain-containing protein [Bacillus piscicola]|uniref:DUF2249 domain-containing protein n=1 Tax=Bacillus piscicola TaxID=1632684 RepID=UPI001F0901E3|nr:DUF2249 domain-containing protein [Bacillus piscicola]
MKLDNRGLEPPQPMMRTLEALEELEDTSTLLIINDRQPMFLYPELEERGYTHESEPLEDGSWQITIRKETG